MTTRLITFIRTVDVDFDPEECGVWGLSIRYRAGDTVEVEEDFAAQAVAEGWADYELDDELWNLQNEEPADDDPDAPEVIV